MDRDSEIEVRILLRKLRFKNPACYTYSHEDEWSCHEFDVGNHKCFFERTIGSFEDSFELYNNKHVTSECGGGGCDTVASYLNSSDNSIENFRTFDDLLEFVEEMQEMEEMLDLEEM